MTGITTRVLSKTDDVYKFVQLGGTRPRVRKGVQKEKVNILVKMIYLLITLTVVKMTLAEVPCVIPTRTRHWTLGGVETVVLWGVGFNLTCHNRLTCFGDLHEANSPMEPQIMPLEIQEGQELRFQSVFAGRSGILPILPFAVDAPAFRSCNISGGTPVTESATNESFSVNASFLNPGVHYFVVNDPNNVLVRCELGLRLNVTVKPMNCPFTDNVTCSGRGYCVTQQGQADYTCQCCDQFKGNNCQEVDPCQCKYGGECHAKADDPEKQVCACRLGFQGDLCESRVDNMCNIVVCENGGTCSGNQTHFQCTCDAGFSGSHCEVNINECQSNPCVNGICVDRVNGYNCFCRPGYHGPTCELDYNECASQPCKNEGFCQDLHDNYTCHCQPSFSGRHCDKKTSLCSTVKPCLNGGHCQEMTFNYKCNCRSGFAGAHCEVNVDDCAAQPCLNGGTCIDRVAGYTCLCHEMHAGPNCQYPLDMFGPLIDVRHSGDEDDHDFHVHNMYVVTAMLSCAVLLVLGVLVTCYCRVYSTHPMTFLRRNPYLRHRDEPTRPVDISSVSNPRLSIDAIWEATSLNCDVPQQASPRLGDSLRARDI